MGVAGVGGFDGVPPGWLCGAVGVGGEVVGGDEGDCCEEGEEGCCEGWHDGC